MKRRIKINYFWLLVLSLMIAFYITVLTTDTKPEVSRLSIDDKKSIVSELGIGGYRKAVNLNCDKALVEYLKSGKWIDSWCAGHYSHVER